MRLDLRFTARPLKELWCQAVIGFIFQEPLQVSNTVDGLDSKTLCFLDFLQKRGFLTGTKGEILLIASQDRVKADKIFLKGLGDRPQYNIGVLAEMTGEIGISLGRMEISEIGIHIPAADGAKGEYISYLEVACMQIVDAFIAHCEKTPDFSLKLIFSVNTCFMEVLEPALRDFRARLDLKVDHTIVIK